MSGVEATPCEPNPGSSDMRVKTIKGDSRGLPRVAAASDGQAPVIRRMMLMKKDFVKFGFTDRCAGCEAMRLNKGVQRQHSQQCRKRMQEEMLQTDEGRARLTKDDKRVMEALETQAPEEETEEDGPQAGDRVRICGLIARPELNGRVIKLIEYSRDHERWKAELEDGLIVN